MIITNNKLLINQLISNWLLYLNRSHDGFKTDQTGYMQPDAENSKYIDQVIHIMNIYIINILLLQVNFF